MIRTEPLSRSFDRVGFSCGVEVLDLFLQCYAMQDQRKRLSRTFVATGVEQVGSNRSILGFFTLSVGVVGGPACNRSPEPVVRLCRLAIDQKYQRMGLGEGLLHDVCYKVQSIAKIIGVYAIVVDAKDMQVKLFYERYGLSRPGK